MMVLYSGSTDPFSQRCRFVLFEKGMDFEIRDIDLYHKPEDINVMNPYGNKRYPKPLGLGLQGRLIFIAMKSMT